MPVDSFLDSTWAVLLLFVGTGLLLGGVRRRPSTRAPISDKDDQ